MTRNLFALALQTSGATAISTGVFMVFPPAGVVIAGVFLVLFGLAIERRNAE
jgi:hypothetical protein